MSKHSQTTSDVITPKGLRLPRWSWYVVGGAMFSAVSGLGTLVWAERNKLQQQDATVEACIAEVKTKQAVQESQIQAVRDEVRYVRMDIRELMSRQGVAPKTPEPSNDTRKSP